MPNSSLIMRMTSFFPSKWLSVRGLGNRNLSLNWQCSGGAERGAVYSVWHVLFHSVPPSLRRREFSASSAERLNCNSAEGSSGVVVYGGTILQDMPKVPVRLGQKSPVATSTG